MGGSGENCRSREERCAAAEKLNEGWDIKDHVIRVPVLDRNPVDDGADGQDIGIGNFVGSDEAGAERAKRVERLSATPLTASLLLLPIPRAHVVGARLAEHKVQSLLAGDVFA